MVSAEILPNMQIFNSFMLGITKTCLFKYTENFTTKKWKFSDEKFWYFFIFLLKT